MNDRPWWMTVVQWTVWALIMSAVMGWLGRSRLKERPTAETRVMRHPTSTLIVGVVCVGFFAAMAVVSAVSIDGGGTWWITLIFVGFALMSLPMLLDYFIARHEVTEEGLRYRKLNGARKFMRWSDVRQVRYAATMKWFRVESTSGEVARLSVMLMGLPEFARVLLDRVPDGVVQSGTESVLQATAEGRPPSMWM